MSSLATLDALAVQFTFRRRPATLPADLRPIWRVALLCVVLRTCRQNRSSLQRLHVLNWALRSAEGREEFKLVISGQISPTDVTVRYEPAFIQAIDFAIGNRVVSRVGGDKLELLEKGVALADTVLADPDLLGPEKAFLTAVKSRIAETRIQQIVYREGA